MKSQIKNFFYNLGNQEEKEREINDFLLKKGNTVKKILQSSSGTSLDMRTPNFIDSTAVITVIYEE